MHPQLPCLLLAALLAGPAGAGRPDSLRVSERERVAIPPGAKSGTAPETPPAQGSAAAKDGLTSVPGSLRTLIDQEGNPFSFARLGGKTVLANFMFTHCPVSCPVQTQALVGIQRALPSALRSRVRIVSVTVDPERDSAAVLKRYAEAMGADLSGWSFVTGEASELDRLQRYYSVMAGGGNGGEYDHQVGVYLLDARGRLMQKYTGDFDKARLLKEIGQVDALGR